MKQARGIKLLYFLLFFGIQAEEIGHECGVAFVQLKHPLSYYDAKYGHETWGLNKIRLLMEKQRNRGQDGAGIGIVKDNGEIKRVRALKPDALDKVFIELENNLNFLGKSYLGHLRYGTYGAQGISLCQPSLRYSNSIHKKLLIAGNFNLTNIPELSTYLDGYGINPVKTGDTNLILELLRLKTTSPEVALKNAVKEVCELWDGGYFFIGILGTNDFFICRDPHGIRPGFYYEDSEVFAAASERAALMSSFGVTAAEIKEVPAGAIFTKQGGRYKNTSLESKPLTQCSFERIYFSRSEDPDIYKERKALGQQLAQRVFDTLEGDIENAVFCYIPNTSQIAFIGLIEELEFLTKNKAIKRLHQAQLNRLLSYEELKKLAAPRIRVEQVLNKNQKLRTFIAQDKGRNDLVQHMYNVTKGIVKPTDTIVALDDSIVRGTTLETSIMRQLIELNPKNIVIISSAPPIAYPDCYGIDMSQIGRFVAFRAAVELTQEKDNEELFENLYESCLEELEKPNPTSNVVKKLYDQFTHLELEKKIAELIKPKKLAWKGEIKVIYQTLDGLHKAIPAHTGDWYFSGDYPTPGGVRVVNKSFLQWWQGSEKRAY